MNRYYFAALLLLASGCASRQTPAPAVAVAPTAIPTTTPIFVAVPPMPALTPILNSAMKQLQQEVLAETQRLRNASPEQDFAQAWAEKNTRFVGVKGVGLELPGVPHNRVSKLINRYGVGQVVGTGDVLSIPEQADLQGAAFNYATRYNQLLLAKLDEQTAAQTN